MEEALKQIRLVQIGIDKLEETINGNGRLGLAGKVEIIWRTYVWLLCAMSAAGGSVITWLVMRGI